jgi:hypothetical protein
MHPIGWAHMVFYFFASDPPGIISLKTPLLVPAMVNFKHLTSNLGDHKVTR